MIGHSLGEITSLYASGMLDLKSAIELIGTRGYSFDGIPQEERGQMVSIKSDRDSVTELIEKNGLNVGIANINSRDQIVVGGKKDEITKLTEILTAQKKTYTLLQVSHAFHTDITRGAADNFYSKIKGIKFNLPKAEVMCCHSSGFYPSNVEEIGNMPGLLKDQIVSPVNFADSVVKLYEKGVRLLLKQVRHRCLQIW
jgi:acyl transferase domain-containing protein